MLKNKMKGLRAFEEMHLEVEDQVGHPLRGRVWWIFLTQEDFMWWYQIEGMFREPADSTSAQGSSIIRNYE